MTDAAAPRFVTTLSRHSGRWELTRHDPEAPLLTAFDYAATRGDGAFEAMHVWNGRVNKPARHLERMARSLRSLEIAGPPYETWTALIADLVGQWPEGVEGVLKLVYVRDTHLSLSTSNALTPQSDSCKCSAMLHQRRHSTSSRSWPPHGGISSSSATWGQRSAWSPEQMCSS